LTDNDFVQKTIANINLAFKKELDNGFMDIIVPPNEFYPDLERIASQSVGKNTFNDPYERIKWRTKQNYDFSFLMSYSLKRGMYYLQLEDDVVAKYGCISAIFDFINKQKTNKWLILEFTQLGFIGKLFKTRDLPVFINFFLMFATDKPVDWLADSVFSVKTCDPERGHAHCERSQIGLRARYKPSLFQHVGVQSSLKGKTQKLKVNSKTFAFNILNSLFDVPPLKDKDFGKHMIIIRSHQNPPAVLSTSLKTYMKYTIESAYLGQNYFWSFSPSSNDYILFEFNEPISLKKYFLFEFSILYSFNFHFLDIILKAEVPSIQMIKYLMLQYRYKHLKLLNRYLNNILKQLIISIL
jgi:alpha-1,3-mannosylglycoprotein beta-1,4-N-acetylglucosaminyltransferase A/B